MLRKAEKSREKLRKSMNGIVESLNGRVGAGGTTIDTVIVEEQIETT